MHYCSIFLYYESKHNITKNVTFYHMMTTLYNYLHFNHEVFLLIINNYLFILEVATYKVKNLSICKEHSDTRKPPAAI